MLLHTFLKKIRATSGSLSLLAFAQANRRFSTTPAIFDRCTVRIIVALSNRFFDRGRIIVIGFFGTEFIVLVPISVEAWSGVMSGGRSTYKTNK